MDYLQITHELPCGLQIILHNYRINDSCILYQFGCDKFYSVLLAFIVLVWFAYGLLLSGLLAVTLLLTSREAL